MADAGTHCSARHVYQEYHELTHKEGVPFVPDAVWKDIIFSGVILLAIAVCAVHFGPFGPGGQPDPTIIQTAPRPDFFFLWLVLGGALVPTSLSRDTDSF